MAYWWVNQGNHYEEERDQGYLWAPQKTTLGRSRPDWDNVSKLLHNDIVFNYSARKILGYCVVTSQPVPWEAPTKDYQDRPGVLVLAEYFAAQNPFTYAELKASTPVGLGLSLANATPKLDVGTKPAQGYLYALPDVVGTSLWAAVGQPGFVPRDPQIPKPPAGGTTKLRLAAARVGQGDFGQGVREAFGHRCAISGLKRPEPFMLHAAHIKPWSRSSDEERLDPSNGLLLHATLHHAFDAGLFDFDDQGHLIPSARLPVAECALLGIPQEAVLPMNSLTPRRREYLRFRRRVD